MKDNQSLVSTSTRNVEHTAHQYNEEYPRWITDDNFDATLNEVQERSIKVEHTAHQYNEEYPRWITDDNFDATLNEVQERSIKYVCYKSDAHENRLFRLCDLSSLERIKLVDSNKQIVTKLNLASLNITNAKIELLLNKLIYRK